MRLQRVKIFVCSPDNFSEQIRGGAILELVRLADGSPGCIRHGRKAIQESADMIHAGYDVEVVLFQA